MVDIALLSLAFVAGFVTFVNPCGFAILISYVSNYFTKNNKEKKITINLLRGIIAGLIATIGFILIFLTVGFLIKFFIPRDVIGSYLSLVNISLGALLVGIGFLVLFNRMPSISLPIKSVTLSSNFSFFEYGIAYALASLGCTLPIFLSIVIGTLSVSLADGVLVFFSYSIGMGIVMITVTAALATSKQIVINKLHAFLPHMNKINALLLILVGIYLIYFQVLYGNLIFT